MLAIPLFCPLLLVTFVHCASCALYCFSCPFPENSKNGEKKHHTPNQPKLPNSSREKPDRENSITKMFTTLRSRRPRWYSPLVCIHLLFLWTTSPIINSWCLHSSSTSQPSHTIKFCTIITIQTHRICMLPPLTPQPPKHYRNHVPLLKWCQICSLNPFHATVLFPRLGVLSVPISLCEYASRYISYSC